MEETKKLFYLLLSATLFISLSTSAQASLLQPTTVTYSSTYVEELGNGYYAITSIDIPENSLYALGTVSGSKKYTIKNAFGSVVASFKLTATFTYSSSGKVTCDSASYSTTVNNNNWSFTTASAYKSEDTAYGNFTAICKVLGVTTNTVTKTITLTCDKDGNLS